VDELVDGRTRGPERMHIARPHWERGVVIRWIEGSRGLKPDERVDVEFGIESIRTSHLSNGSHIFQNLRTSD
jgi:hypothetical protein